MNKGAKEFGEPEPDKSLLLSEYILCDIQPGVRENDLSSQVITSDLTWISWARTWLKPELTRLDLLHDFMTWWSSSWLDFQKIEFIWLKSSIVVLCDSHNVQCMTWIEQNQVFLFTLLYGCYPWCFGFFDQKMAKWNNLHDWYFLKANSSNYGQCQVLGTR